MNMDVGPDTDELYNTLKRLSNSTAMSTVRLRKFAPKPIPFKEEPPRSLTFSVSEVYFTNGKPRLDNELKSEIDDIIGERRNYYQKPTRTIGTSVENCVVSDMISIDIDPESTRLPMMCKLMIIVEGACVERGQRVLVRDAAVQIGDTLGDECDSTLSPLSGVNNNNNNNINNNPTVAQSFSSNGLDQIADESLHSSLRQIKLEASSVAQNGSQGGGGVNQLRIAPKNRVASLDQADQKLKINIVNNTTNANGGLDRSKETTGELTSDFHHGTIPVEINVSSKCNGGTPARRIVGDNIIWSKQKRASTGGIPNEPLTRFRSSENLNNNDNNYHTISSSNSRQHQHHYHHVRSGSSKRPRIFLGRFGRTGSLCDLPLEQMTQQQQHHIPNGYFSTRHADRTNMLAESYLGLNEYLSTPYYQYQCKNRDKRDFSNSTYEDMIELGISIPIRMEHSTTKSAAMSSSRSSHSTNRHRNERHIFITNNKPDFLDSSTIRTFASNMRRFLTERLSRFEAEVTFFRLNENEPDFMPKFRITSPFHAAWIDCEWCRRAMPTNYSYNYHHRHHHLRHHHHREVFSSTNSSGGVGRIGIGSGCGVYVGCGGENDSSFSLKSSPSVTNLMYVKIIDGVLNM